jgi:cysteine-rich repeat protein
MARWAYGLGVAGLAMGGAAIALIVACLPDLPAVALCGNGHIDPEEFCDPGTTANPGCSSQCQIVCPLPDYLDSTSNHCYFPVTAAGTFDDSTTQTSVCSQAKAHVVTYVDDSEVGNVVQNVVSPFASTWPRKPLVWAGQYGSTPAGPFSSTAPYEPGWVGSSCAGCFMYGVSGSASLPVLDGGVEASAPFAVVDMNPSTTNGGGTMAVASAIAKGEIICEREPVGARAAPCATVDAGDGALCFDIVATATRKNYVYNPSSMTAPQAAAYCASLVPSGALVIFESAPEREQVIYELTQLQLLVTHPVPPPAQFWIGLKSSETCAATSSSHTCPEWVWADGTLAPPSSSGSSRPSVWANHEPPPMLDTSPSTIYAYIDLGQGFDVGLAHAVSNPLVPAERPFVCQY